MTIQNSSEPAAFQSFEHDGWESVGAGYERHFARLTVQSVEPTLEAAGVGAGDRVLDLCTGPGMLAAAALKRGAAAVGLDFSGKVVEIARRNVPGAAFRQGDAQALPFEDASFDAVVCGYGIIHLPDPAKALAEIHRVLRPGGRAALSVWRAPGPANGFGLLFGALKAHGKLDVPLPQGPDFFQFSTEPDMTAALQASGFDDVALRAVAQDWAVDEPLGLIAAVLEGTVRSRGLLLAQSEAARAAIEAAVAEGMARFRAAEGSYLVPMPALVGSGRKPPA